MLEHPKYAAFGNEGAPGFDWEVYEDGWNGTGLKENKRVKTKKNSKEPIYCHEPYAQELYNKMNKIRVENVKDIKKGTLLHIDDLTPVSDNMLVATVGNGASNIMVDLSKESGFIRMLSTDTGDTLTKDEFVEYLKMPDFREKVLGMDLTVKVGSDVEKGSIWDGQVEALTNEFKEQIVKNNRAYWAEVIATNGGGFVVEVAKTIKAFMPGSMASNNKIDNYESLVGRTMEVMIESYSDRYGFVVSRKKFINKIRHKKLEPITVVSLVLLSMVSLLNSMSSSTECCIRLSCLTVCVSRCVVTRSSPECKSTSTSTRLTITRSFFQTFPSQSVTLSSHVVRLRITRRRASISHRRTLQ